MRDKIIGFLRTHPIALKALWKTAKFFLLFCSVFIKKNDKSILITSYAGRNFDDSPKAIYEEICNRKEFDDWEIIWAFIEPEKFDIPRGKKVKIDTKSFFYYLIYCKVWISNSGMDRSIGLDLKRTIKIETWHGTPMKKIGIDQNSGNLGDVDEIKNKKKDGKTIRCAQSDYDRKIFERVFNATEESFLMCDLPRNDSLLQYSSDQIHTIRNELGIKDNLKVILYMPTYREFSIDDENRFFIAPPINYDTWMRELGGEYVLLVRAHYGVSAALELGDSDFVKDVSKYPSLNDLYVISNILISDYSSAFFDYSILERPMFCFAYDYEEYAEKRGLYLDIETDLPFPVFYTQEELLNTIVNINFEEGIKQAQLFHNKYTPYAGKASAAVVDKLILELNE